MRYPLISAQPAPQRLALALIATGSILALLLSGCSVGTSSSGGQSTALPTFTPPAISTTQPGHTTTALTGIDGVKPHLAGVPSFTTGDMTQYLSDHPITAPDGNVGPATVVSAGFLSCAAIDAAVVRRTAFGTSTAESSARKDAPSRTRIVEIENQSTCGVWITAPPSSSPAAAGTCGC